MLVFRNIDREYHGLQILDRWMKVVQDFTPVNIFLLLPLFTQTNIGRTYFYFLKNVDQCVGRETHNLWPLLKKISPLSKKMQQFLVSFKIKELTSYKQCVRTLHLGTEETKEGKRRGISQTNQGSLCCVMVVMGYFHLRQ